MRLFSIGQEAERFGMSETALGTTFNAIFRQLLPPERLPRIPRPRHVESPATATSHPGVEPHPAAPMVALIVNSAMYSVNVPGPHAPRSAAEDDAICRRLGAAVYAAYARERGAR